MQNFTIILGPFPQSFSANFLQKDIKFYKAKVKVLLVHATVVALWWQSWLISAIAVLIGIIMEDEWPPQTTIQKGIKSNSKEGNNKKIKQNLLPNTLKRRVEYKTRKSNSLKTHCVFDHERNANAVTSFSAVYWLSNWPSSRDAVLP